MNSRAYTVLGWIVWQVGTRVAKRKMAQNRVKLGARPPSRSVLVGGRWRPRTGLTGGPATAVAA